MSGRVSVKCPECKEWMKTIGDLCDDCKVTLLTIKKKENRNDKQTSRNSSVFHSKSEI